MHTDLPAPIRSVHPAHVLMESTDPAMRAQAFTDLGLRALDREDEETAETHFRSAIALDPTDERPRAGLRRMHKVTQPRQGLWGRLFGRS